MLRNLAAIHGGHHHVQQNQIRFELANGGQALGRPVFRANEISAASFEIQFQQARETFLVIDNQDFLFAHVVLQVLKKIVTITPPCGRFCISMVPPCSSMIFFTTVKPKPVPLPDGLVVKNGSKTFESFSSGMPVPVSSTSVTTSVSPTLNWTVSPSRT